MFGFSPEAFRKYLNNTVWLLGEKVLSMALMFVTGVMLMRYLGATLNGIWGYVIGYVGMFYLLPSLGSKSVLVRELSQGRAVPRLMGSAFGLHLIGACIAWVAIALGLLFGTQPPPPESGLSVWEVRIFVLGYATSYFLHAFTIVESYCYAKLKGRELSVVSFYKAFISSGLKLLAIYWKLDIYWLLGIVWLEDLILAIGYVIIYKHMGEQIRLWAFEWRVAKIMLFEGLLYLVTGAASTFFMGIDQVMIPRLLGDYGANGVYAVAARLSQPWLFISTVVSNSFWPAIANARRESAEVYKRKMGMFFGLLIWMAVGLASVLSLLAPWIIDAVFTEEFAGAGAILRVHIWINVFTFLGSALSKYLMLEKHPKALAGCVLAAGVTNVCLNFWFIPLFGAIGAAYASLIAHFVGYYWAVLLCKGSRPAWGFTHAGLAWPFSLAFGIMAKAWRQVSAGQGRNK